MNEQDDDSTEEKHQRWLEPTTSVQNRDGLWVPAIPLPYYGIRQDRWWHRPRNVYVCEQGGTCAEEFDREVDYRGHYALVHVMGLD